MANIDIEKKNGGGSWLWILGLLLLVAALAFIFWPKETSRDQDNVTGIATTEQMAAGDDNYASDDRAGTTSQPVTSFVNWSENMSQNEMGLGHEFTKNGLMNMADALAAVAERAPGVNRQQFNSKLTTMRNKAIAITNNWESTSHANKIKDAFRASADVMEELQRSSFPAINNDVQRVRQSIDAMDTKTLTLDQKEKVKDVFKEAAEVVQSMDQNLNR
ncbi:hypothetical protein [Telluribacter sp.]|jgi:hypothetical protein|uniref:hypothetical protein n=1 Tax=Telluribacter sp. TaxID=1978767 RepID=UPI002E108C0E|nr:hypothetical protein [Telluribacter sp.]